MANVWKGICAAKRFLAYKRNHRRKAIIIEISNICNARCYYCQTGYDNRQGATISEPHFMEVNMLEKILQYVHQQGFLQGQSLITLHNWHEPLLHPDFAAIIQTIGRRKHLIEVSTNANVLPTIPSNFDASPIAMTVISMCGFSQASYDKIHQFDFEHIKRNIEMLVKSFRKHGCFGRFVIAYHIYQFNTNEIPAARAFAQSLGIDFWPNFAFIADGERLSQYLKGQLPSDYLLNVSKDLFMGFFTKDLQPAQTCPVARYLTINTDGNCLMCCNDNTDLGSIFEMTPEKWDHIHQTSAVCHECMAIGKADLKISENLALNALNDLKNFDHFKSMNGTVIRSFLKTMLQ
jgi:MoaA/NifB/PqqE/SkfB family radical SAM enzyme